MIVQFTVNVQWHIALGTFHSTVLHAESASRLLVQWRRSQVKSGGINIEEIEGVGSGAVASPVGGLGAWPEKKINFALKIMQF